MILGAALAFGGVLAIGQLGDPLIWGASPPPAADLEERSMGLLLGCVATGLAVAYVVTAKGIPGTRRALLALAALALGVLLVTVLSYDEQYPVDRSLRFSEAEAVLSGVFRAAIDDATAQGIAPELELEVPWDYDSVLPYCYSMLGSSTGSARQELTGVLTPAQVETLDLGALGVAFAAAGYPAGSRTDVEPAFRHVVIERADGSVLVRLETPCLPDS